MEHRLYLSKAIVPFFSKVLSCVQFFVTPWTVAHQAPLPMEFSRQDYWSGLSFPTPGDLPNSVIKFTSVYRAGTWEVLFSKILAYKKKKKIYQCSKIMSLHPPICLIKKRSGFLDLRSKGMSRICKESGAMLTEITCKSKEASHFSFLQVSDLLVGKPISSLQVGKPTSRWETYR